MNDVAHERKCHICKRHFIMYPDWVYKKGHHEHCYVFCSWKCLRAYESGQSTAKETREKIKQALKDGLTVREVSILLGVDQSRVAYWKEKMRKELDDERETGT